MGVPRRSRISEDGARAKAGARELGVTITRQCGCWIGGSGVGADGYNCGMPLRCVQK
jgi:hypothetical protein